MALVVLIFISLNSSPSIAPRNPGIQSGMPSLVCLLGQHVSYHVHFLADRRLLLLLWVEEWKRKTQSDEFSTISRCGSDSLSKSSWAI